LESSVAACAGISAISLRALEALLFEDGVIVTCEMTRCWWDKFGVPFSQDFSTWHLDEMFVTLQGKSELLWPVVDVHGR